MYCETIMITYSGIAIRAAAIAHTARGGRRPHHDSQRAKLIGTALGWSSRAEPG